MEFNRIVGSNLKQGFYKRIDQHSLRLIEIFQSKRGNIGQLLTQLSQQTKTKEPTDIQTLVLTGLPIILGDNPTDFYKACFDDSDDSFHHLDVGILLVEQEGAVFSYSLHLSPASLKIVIEGEVIVDNIHKAVCILFGLICTSSEPSQVYEEHVPLHQTGAGKERRRRTGGEGFRSGSLTLGAPEGH
ncbi:uncharacterized protein [Hoplias malabaricus]|uniref:uncharacterized protein isoform X2 n=1 Tax=Hoplias malabaricus TaxID=27720 RepID=UPI003462453C